MGTDEITVIDYLKQFPKSFTSAVEICKKAGGRRRFARDPDWARPVLRRLESDGHLESNEFGHFKLSSTSLAKYTSQSRTVQREERCREAITTHVVNMLPEDDEKPFSTLIREVLSADYAQETGLHEAEGTSQ